MKLFEYEVKQILKKRGIEVPRGKLATTPQEAREAAEEIQGPVLVKAQALTGRRVLFGGIKTVCDPDEAERTAGQLLGSIIGGFKVNAVLVEEMLSISKEYYIGVTIDEAAKKPVAIASSMGGSELEDLVERFPERVVKRHVDPFLGFFEFEAREIIKEVGLSGDQMAQAAVALKVLYDVFWEYDGELIEINPLVITENGEIVAVDAKLNINDYAVFRHPEFGFEKRWREKLLDLNEREYRAKLLDSTYVDLEGDIGIIGSGAGPNLHLIDLIELMGGKPANFFEVGGKITAGANPDKGIQKGLDILLSNPGIRSVIVNIVGGATRCDELARGIIQYIKSRGIDAPFVVRVRGSKDHEARDLLLGEGIPYEANLYDAVRKIIELARGS